MQKIMFNDEYGLTAAVLARIKTQTRRIVPQKALDAWNDIDDGDEYSRSVYAESNGAKMRNFLLEYATYKVGEEVAVAQCYRYIYCQEPAERLSEEYSMWFLKQKGLTDSQAWRNKMFVKPDFMPHRIRIEKVRVERLQDISDVDCLAEGIITMDGNYEVDKTYGWGDKKETYFTPKGAYAALIDSISGKGTWERNPWVFVYNFKLVK